MSFKEERDAAAEKHRDDRIRVLGSYTNHMCEKSFKAGYSAALTSSVVRELYGALEYALNELDDGDDEPLDVIVDIKEALAAYEAALKEDK